VGVGEENPHWIQPVENGERISLAVFFTCDYDYAIDLAY
jgi:hypothetical protein